MFDVIGTDMAFDVIDSHQGQVFRPGDRFFCNPGGIQGLGYARPDKPFFSSLRERAPYGSLAALRDRGLVRRLTRSITLMPA